MFLGYTLHVFFNAHTNNHHHFQTNFFRPDLLSSSSANFAFRLSCSPFTFFCVYHITSGYYWINQIQSNRSDGQHHSPLSSSYKECVSKNLFQPFFYLTFTKQCQYFCLLQFHPFITISIKDLRWKWVIPDSMKTWSGSPNVCQLSEKNIHITHTHQSTKDNSISLTKSEDNVKNVYVYI